MDTMTWPGSVLREIGLTLLHNSQTCRIECVSAVAGMCLTSLGVVTENAGIAAGFGLLSIATVCEWAFGARDSNSPTGNVRPYCEREPRRGV
jgi:hypothetical protein